MPEVEIETISNHFSSMTDPRVEGRTDHKLIDIADIIERMRIWK